MFEYYIIKLDNYYTMYYCRLIYELCLHKCACFFISPAMSQNLSASLKIFLSYQAIYQYLLDNLVSRLLFVPTVIAALYPSNTYGTHSDVKLSHQLGQGFHLGLWPNLNPLLIVCYQVCVDVSLLCSLLTIVYVTMSSVVSQVALFPSYNSLCNSKQYCLLGHFIPFLQQSVRS